MTVLPIHCQLWDLVHRSSSEPGELVRLLHTVASLPLEDRLPILSLIPLLMAMDDVSIRESALRVMSGASGKLAMQRIVGALADPELRVRVAAVEALAQCSIQDSACMAFAVFHRDVSVRQAVLRLPLPFPNESQWCSYLLADAECVDEAANRILQSNDPLSHASIQNTLRLYLSGQLSEAILWRLLDCFFHRSLRLPESLTACLHSALELQLISARDFFSAEWLSRKGKSAQSLASRWLAERISSATSRHPLSQLITRCGPSVMIFLIRASEFKTQRNVEHILETARSKNGLARMEYSPEPDVIDELLRHLWPLDGPFFEELQLSNQEGKRFAASALLVAQSEGSWNKWIHLAATRHYPELIVTSKATAEVNDFTLRNLVRSSSYRPKVLQRRITDLLAALVRSTGDEVVDLLAAAAVLTFLDSNRFEKAIRKIKPERIARAARADTDRSIEFFALKDSDDYAGRNRLLMFLKSLEKHDAPSSPGYFTTELGTAGSSVFAQVLARLCFRFQHADLRIATEQNSLVIAEIFRELICIVEQIPDADAGVNPLCLGHAAGSQADRWVLRHCINSLPEDPTPKQWQIAVDFWGALVDNAPVRSLVDAVSSLTHKSSKPILSDLQEELGRPTGSPTVSDYKARIRGLRIKWADQSKRSTSQPQVDEVASQPITIESKPSSRSRSSGSINESTDIEWLAKGCSSSDLTTAELSAVRLLDLGTAGADALMEQLRKSDEVELHEAVAWTSTIWPRSMAERFLYDILPDSPYPAKLRFIAGLGMESFGFTGVYEALLNIVMEPNETAWFTEDMLRRLASFAPSEYELALRLIRSNQKVAVSRAASILTAQAAAGQSTEATTALVEGLQYSPQFYVAPSTQCLVNCGVAAAHPALAHALQNDWLQLDRLQIEAQSTSLNTITGRQIAEHTLTSSQPGSEGQLKVLSGLATSVRTSLLSRRDAAETFSTEVSLGTENIELFLSYSPYLDVRQRAARWIQEINEMSLEVAGSQLGRVHSVFAWGVRTALKLTGKRIRIRLIGNDQLGYMRHGQPEIYVSPLPMLEKARHGEEIVKGLIVHELGHHMFHASDEHRTCGAEANKEGLAELWNIVLDEHLERNLRTIDPEYGQQLKHLNAYAFQHKPKVFTVEHLLLMVGCHGLSILSQSDLMPSRRAGEIEVYPGLLLKLLAEQGSSFARFFRALLMGLGNRDGDPKVERALALFDKRFRHSSARELLEITRCLKEIFGDEIHQLNQWNTETLIDSADSQIAATAVGASDENTEASIRRVVDGIPEGTYPPPSSQPTNSRDRKIEFNLNVTQSERFDEIHEVEILKYDRQARKKLSDRVAAQARHLQWFLRDLGLDVETQRMRTSGRRIDRSRMTPLLLYRDPRVMMSRQIRSANDLFLSVVVDCSSSMSGNDIEKARLFATLVADACVGLSNVDTRFFGFTGVQIFDAGDARFCAAHALAAGGANNDAAGLSHAANAALRSGRKAKVIIMISDGLPSSCSVDALRGLVRRLTIRHNMVCAQVATVNLSEVCFPNYVVLRDNEFSTAVAEFGNILRRLIQKAMQ